MNKTLAGIQSLAYETGQLIKKMSSSITITNKEGLGNFVTNADLASEELIVSTIKKSFPHDTFLSEESHTDYSKANDSGVWIIDPIDGTTNFAFKRDFSAVSIAYAEKGSLQLSAVYNPFTDIMYSAEKGKGSFLGSLKLAIPPRQPGYHWNIATGPAYSEDLSRRNLELMLKINPFPSYRVFAAAALELCWVASGTIDVYFHTDVKPWDNAAAFLVVEEAGGVARKFDNTPAFFTDKEIIVGHPDFVTKISQQFSS